MKRHRTAPFWRHPDLLTLDGQVGVGTADENRPTPLNPPRPYSPPPIPAPDSHEDYDDDGFTENEFTINLRAAQEKMNRNLTTLEDLVDDIRYQMQFNDGRMARVTDRVIGPAVRFAESMQEYERRYQSASAARPGTWEREEVGT